MTKEIEINMDKYFANYVTTPIREKEDIIVLLLQTMKLFLTGEIAAEESFGKAILRIDKMSRIFYVTDNKFFSINFPFNLDVTEDGTGLKEMKFYDFVTGVEFDQQIISALLSLFSQEVLQKDDLDDFHYIFLSTGELIGETQQLDAIWNLFKRLMLFEPGYLRYDYDPVHHNGHLHPLNHLDVYFSPGNTFKVGLQNRIEIQEFLDILDLQTNCHYIRKV